MADSLTSAVTPSSWLKDWAKWNRSKWANNFPKKKKSTLFSSLREKKGEKVLINMIPREIRQLWIVFLTSLHIIAVPRIIQVMWLPLEKAILCTSGTVLSLHLINFYITEKREGEIWLETANMEILFSILLCPWCSFILEPFPKSPGGNESRIFIFP